MESRKVKKFSIGMMLVTFVFMLSMAFLMPTKVFAETQAPNSTSDTLKLNYAGVDYKVKPSEGNGEYAIIPTATS